jgi:hypothetical protein
MLAKFAKDILNTIGLTQFLFVYLLYNNKKQIVMKLELSSKHKAAIEAGRVKRNRLIRAAKMAAAGLTNDDGSPIHYYIYGPSGIGKTYWSEKASSPY